MRAPAAAPTATVRTEAGARRAADALVADAAAEGKEAEPVRIYIYIVHTSFTIVSTHDGFVFRFNEAAVNKLARAEGNSELSSSPFASRINNLYIRSIGCRASPGIAQRG